MSVILTLVAADAAAFPLKAEYFNDFGTPTWLAQDKAGHVALETPLSHAQLRDLRDKLDADKIDVFQTPADNRRKKLLLADMDSTIVAEETLDELAAFAGLKDKVADITAKAMNGELDFHGAVRERVALLKGLSTSALQETLDETIVNPGARDLVATLKASGATCVLVSGGFTVFTDPVGRDVGFDYNHGNTLGVNAGGDALTGEVIDPILDKHAKVHFLEHYCKQLGLTPDDVMTIGDGANDIPMLERAGFGVGYHPKPAVENAIPNIIRHGDLSSALYAMGFGEGDFA